MRCRFHRSGKHHSHPRGSAHLHDHDHHDGHDHDHGHGHDREHDHGHHHGHAGARRGAVDRVAVANVNVPGYFRSVDGPRYRAMKKALLKVLPKKAPGLTQAEMLAAALPHLPDKLFPGGDKAGWWAKTVQLDLEAKQVVLRDPRARPLRWTRAR
jgi:hypothetical protein